MKTREIYIIGAMRKTGKFFFATMQTFVEVWKRHMLDNKNRYQPGVAKRNRTTRRRARKACKK